MYMRALWFAIALVVMSPLTKELLAQNSTKQHFPKPGTTNVISLRNSGVQYNFQLNNNSDYWIKVKRGTRCMISPRNSGYYLTISNTGTKPVNIRTRLYVYSENNELPLYYHPYLITSTGECAGVAWGCPPFEGKETHEKVPGSGFYFCYDNLLPREEMPPHFKNGKTYTRDVSNDFRNDGKKILKYYGYYSLRLSIISIETTIPINAKTGKVYTIYNSIVDETGKISYTFPYRIKLLVVE